MADLESIDAALLVWVRLYEGCSEVEDLSQLKDAKYIARMLSAMYPKHAVAEVETEHDNWMVSQATLTEVTKKLQSILAHYNFNKDLKDLIDCQKISEEGDVDQIRELLKLLLVVLPGSKMDKKIKIALINDHEDDDMILQELLDELYNSNSLQLDEHLSDTNGLKSTWSLRTHNSFAFPSPRKSQFAKPADYESKIEQLQKEMKALRSENLGLWQENAFLKSEEQEPPCPDTPHIKSPRSPAVQSDLITDALKTRDLRIHELESALEEAQAKLVAKDEELQEAQCQEGKRVSGQVKGLKEMRDTLAEDNRALRRKLDREVSNVVVLEKELKQAKEGLRELMERQGQERFEGESEVPREPSENRKSQPEVMETPITIASPAVTEPVEPETFVREEQQGPRRLGSCTLEMLKLNERLKEKDENSRENHIKPIMELVNQMTSETRELQTMIELRKQESLQRQPEYPHDFRPPTTARATARALTPFPLDSHRSIQQTITEKIKNGSFSRRMVE